MALGLQVSLFLHVYCGVSYDLSNTAAQGTEAAVCSTQGSAARKQTPPLLRATTAQTAGSSAVLTEPLSGNQLICIKRTIL